jgi:hypothetical protein
MKAPYRFMLRWALALSPVLVFVVLAEVFFRRAGESIGLETAALYSLQTGKPSAYMPVFFAQQHNRYHYERVKRIRPEVLVLGSSRVTRFRAEMFSRARSFYNVNTSIRCVGDLEQFLAALPPDYAPRAVLLGVDAWWFNPHPNARRDPTFAEDIHKDDTHNLEARFPAYHTLVGLLRTSKLGPGLIARILRSQDDGLKRFGLAAWMVEGAREDGSLQRLDRAETPVYREKLPTSLEALLRAGRRSLAPARDLDAPSLERFVAAVRALEKRGTRIIGVAGPFSSGLQKVYAEHPVEYGIFGAFRRDLPVIFAMNGWEFFDGSAPTDLGLDDNCLIDEVHAMETYSVAVLQRLAQNSSVREALQLDPDYLKSLLDNPATTPWHPAFGALPKTGSSAP